MIDPEWVEVIAEWAAGAPAVEQVFVFGSRARGNGAATSDLDLGVRLGGGRDERLVCWIENASAWREALSARLPVLVDLQLADSDLSTGAVGPAVQREGTCIYRRTGAGA